MGTSLIVPNLPLDDDGTRASGAPRSRILVVDDEAAARRLFARVLARAGYDVEVVESAEAALSRIEDAPFDLLLSDVRLGGMNGIELCREVRLRKPTTLLVLITAFAALDDAVAGMHEGVRDYVTKPCSPEHLLHVVRRALRERDLGRENQRLKAALVEREGLSRLLGNSPAIAAVRDQALRSARSSAPVLIQGASGVGKELVARAIHVLSERAAGEFVAVNASAVSQSLFERELFGHVRGAFTGAHEDAPGLFDAAHGGTLFLDEIGELQVELQPKLLRVLEESEVVPVGGVRPRSVDVRLIAATNRDLEADVRANRFRRDLYYRLNVVSIRVPSLAERREDIPMLAEHFLREASQRLDRELVGFSPDALAYLSGRAWPGNVRELRNAIERASVFAQGSVITRADLMVPTHRETLDGSLDHSLPYPFEDLTLEAVEQIHIRHVVEACHGNRSRAADVLGISRSTLWQKLKDEPE
ncbi:MAG: sigma-54 dependent transcriptional regulator [bacterium]